MMPAMKVVGVLVLGLLSLPLAAQAPSAYQTALDGARLAMAARRYDQARKFYARAAKSPGADLALCDLGMAHADLARASFKDAEKECEAAAHTAANATERATACALAGVVLLDDATYEDFQSGSSGKQKKLLALGEQQLRAALALMPNEPALHFNLATALLREGDVAAGDGELQSYLRLAPNGASAALARRYLANPDLALANHAPDFAIVTEDGAQYSPPALTGKVVLLDFWGSWCGPCRQSVPLLVQLWKQYSQANFVLISVDSGEPQAKGERFIARNRMVWPQYWDGSRAMQTAFQVRAFPTFILLDSRGVIRGRWEGEEGWRTGALLSSEVHDWLKRSASGR